jgi:hypothetical protein
MHRLQHAQHGRELESIMPQLPLNQMTMKLGTAMLQLIGAGLVLAFLAVSAPAYTQSGILLGVPPITTQRDVAPSYLKIGTTFRATIRAYCEAKRVEVTWSWSQSGTFAPSDVSVTESFAVGYWPTAVEAVASGKLVVAGKERAGDTRIEVWTTRAPLVVQPAPGSSGTTKLQGQGLDNIDVVYDDQVSGKDIVRGIVNQRGLTNSVLLQFHDSRVLYSLRWDAMPGVLTSVLTPSAQPALSGDFDSYAGGNHQTAGYVYVFSNLEDLGLTPWLVLTDSNRDGTIDTSEVLTSAQYISRGLNDRLQYSEYAGI